jgi:hypothetical protein
LEYIHTKISSNYWKSGDGLVTTKTPTVILFDENGKFQSFGYEAEEAYTRLLEEGTHIPNNSFRSLSQQPLGHFVSSSPYFLK